MKRLMLLLALSAVGCDAGIPAKAKTNATVSLTSVAFADDCGGAPPHDAPVTASAAKRAPPSAAAPSMPSEEAVSDVAVRRRCEQTAMQLAIIGEAGSELHIKSVDVFDADGRSLGTLSASKPMRWNDAKAAYEAWDGKVLAGSMSVSYVLSQPTFIDRFDARDRTYTVKVLAALGAIDQPLKTTVMVVGRPAPVPT